MAGRCHAERLVALRTERGSDPGELLSGRRSAPPNLDAVASVTFVTLWKSKDPVPRLWVSAFIVYNFARHEMRVPRFVNTHPCTTTFRPCPPAKNIRLPNKAVGGMTPRPLPRQQYEPPRHCSYSCSYSYSYSHSSSCG